MLPCPLMTQSGHSGWRNALLQDLFAGVLFWLGAMHAGRYLAQLSGAH
jgi:hypothetical protein